MTEVLNNNGLLIMKLSVTYFYFFNVTVAYPAQILGYVKGFLTAFNSLDGMTKLMSSEF